jgi:hypothetical protein
MSPPATQCTATISMGCVRSPIGHVVGASSLQLAQLAHTRSAPALLRNN